MSFESRILCVFEGESREPKYFNSLRAAFFGDNDIYYCCYGNDLYELFDELEDDEDLNIFDLIEEKNTVEGNKKLFENYTSEDFSQVFMFFDFECHDDKFDIEKIKKMVSLFSDETSVGKLFISYPMIESVRDIPSLETFIGHKVHLKNAVGKLYKPLSVSGIADYQDPRKVCVDRWTNLIRVSVEKTNYMTSGQHGQYNLVQQTDILNSQIHLMEQESHLYVLCSFPLFAFHQKGQAMNF